MKGRVRKLLVWQTTQNIKRMHNEIVNEGYTAEREQMIELINTMIAFVKAVVKQPEDENGKADKSTIING